jgi:hypothetical protein
VSAGGRRRRPTGSPTATPATTRPTSRPGASWRPCQAGGTSSTSPEGRRLRTGLRHGDAPHRRQRRPVRHGAAPDRCEDKWFRDWAQTSQPRQAEAIRLPRRPSRRARPGALCLPRLLPSAEGHRRHLGARRRQGRPATTPPGRGASPPRSRPWPPSSPAPNAGCATAPPSTKPPRQRWPTRALPARSPSPSAKPRRRPTARSAAAGANTRWRKTSRPWQANPPSQGRAEAGGAWKPTRRVRRPAPAAVAEPVGPCGSRSGAVGVSLPSARGGPW